MEHQDFPLAAAEGRGDLYPREGGGGKQKWTCSIQLYIMYRVYTGIFYDFFKTEFCFYSTGLVTGREAVELCGRTGGRQRPLMELADVSIVILCRFGI